MGTGDLSILIFTLIGYLLGSLPFAVIVSRAFGLTDPRRHGSGNPGATNVLRTGHKLAAALTLLGDAAKGWLAMWLAGSLGADVTAMALAGTAAFLGHLFPVFLNFKGGKGVATALGVLIGLSGWLALAAGSSWLLTALITRYSSLAALIAAITAASAGWWLLVDPTAASCVMVISLLLIWRHRNNIRHLLDGTESRIGSNRTSHATGSPNATDKP